MRAFVRSFFHTHNPPFVLGTVERAVVQRRGREAGHRRAQRRAVVSDACVRETAQRPYQRPISPMPMPVPTNQPREAKSFQLTADPCHSLHSMQGKGSHRTFPALPARGACTRRRPRPDCVCGRMAVPLGGKQGVTVDRESDFMPALSSERTCPAVTLKKPRQSKGSLS